MRTGNPALTAKTFSGFRTTQNAMTVSGTVNKTFFLLVLLVASAGYTWKSFYDTYEVNSAWIWGPLLGALAVAIAVVIRKEWAPVLAPAYAVLEGLALGGISVQFEVMYPGIVIQAVGLTFGTLFCLLAAYRAGVIRATENFKLGVVSATGALALFYLVSFGLSFFGIRIPFLHESGPIGILFSIGVTVLAALNLVLDLDFIEDGERRGAPRFMEWYAAFGLIVTLVWLYLEILRLLAKTRER